MSSVRTFARVMLGLNALVLIWGLLSPMFWSAPERSTTLAIIVAVGYVASPLALYIFARRARPSMPLVAASVATYVVILMVAAADEVARLDVAKPTMGPSWVCIALLVFSLLVPVPIRLYVGLLALTAAYLPTVAVAAYALGVMVKGNTVSVLITAALASIPTWLCAVFAWLLIRQRDLDWVRYQKTRRELEQLGSYTLQIKLGEGGMGEVWRAEHAFLARPAAVKIIRPEVLGGLDGDADDRARAKLALGRFEREAKATAQLSSAHTIRVFDFGRGPNDSFFYVMELLDGLDLFSLISRHGAQCQARVHHILLQACDSLAEAHDQGMVHRDIKPANLFLCRKGKTLDHVKVLDFGLVRSDPGAKPEGVDTLPRLTRQGIISGSPAFMSPEQAEGADDLDR
ncbi:MAG: serine/threonine-protein kinase, partial [Myxococcota bacterium]